MDAHAIEPETCTPRASYLLEFGLNFMPHRRRKLRHLFIGKPELLRTQRHMENIGKSGSREEALSRLHSFISVITFIGFYTWWAYSVYVCTYLDDNFLLFCLCYCTSFNNGQEQLSSNKQALDSAALPRSSSSPCMHACML